jgi:hypothetical protein
MIYIRVIGMRLTFVPDLRPVKSSVVPDGTATLDRTMVEHEVLDLLAEAAPLEPENVHEAARFSSVAGAVTAGAGAANATEEKTASPARPMKERMVTRRRCKRAKR